MLLGGCFALALVPCTANRDLTEWKRDLQAHGEQATVERLLFAVKREGAWSDQEGRTTAFKIQPTGNLYSDPGTKPRILLLLLDCNTYATHRTLADAY